MLTELSEVLDRLKQGPSQSQQRFETSETGGDETDTSRGRWKILSKKFFRMKKVYAATELGRFFVTGPSDAASMPSLFYSRVCPKNVSVLLQGYHEVLRHFQGSRHFARDQRLRLETPGWRLLDFHGNPLDEAELERQMGKIKKGHFVVRDREHPSAENLITDEADVVEPQFPVFTKMSCLVDALRMGGSYELIGKLWAQSVLTTGPVNSEVAWTRDGILVGSVKFQNHFVSLLIYIVVLLLVNHFNWSGTRNLSRVVEWAKAHHFYSLEFEQRGVAFWAFMRTWEKDTFCRVALAVTDRFSSDATYIRVVSAGVICGCCGWFDVPRCCFWRVFCVGRHSRRLFGK